MSRVKQKLLIGKDESRLPGLQYDGENKVCCGLCGKGYVWLGNHIIQGHHLPLDEYRELFNLNRTQPLCTPEYSAKKRAAFIKRGMVRKYAGQIDVTAYSKNAAKPYRHQGKITLQDSPAVAKRQIQNSLKAQVKNIEYMCTLCGTMFYGRACDQSDAKHYCPKCKHVAYALHSRKWRESHPEASKASLARYRETHLEELRKRGREYWRAKHPIRRIVTQPCLNCGQITTGRTSRGKLFCLDCRRIGAPAHLYYMDHKAK